MSTMTLEQLQDKALWVRRKVLEMAVKANSGHVSTAMSQTEILVALYYGGVLKHDPKNPHWEDRDYFLLSKGQGGIGLYPILADRGFFPVEDLDNFCGKGSTIGVHAEWHCPGIETISGSLGHNLCIATGLAQSLKNEGKDNLVFCLTGDGELHEGSNWEAMFTASQQKLDNLVVIVDNNDQATLGHLDDYKTPKDGPGVQSLSEKFESFGFEVWRVVDGNDMEKVHYYLQSICRYHTLSKPLCIIANTKKGKGLSCMEDKRLWHYRVPAGKDLDQCWEDLKVPAEARPIPNVSQVKHAKGMRDCFFDALYERFKQDKKLVFITADNGFPTIEKWAETLPGQFYQVGIAEQQMVGMAAGFALRGYKPFCYAIAPFVTTRVHEFIKLDVCAMKLPICMIGVGAGYAYDIMSTTHHTAEDIAIMRALPDMHIYSPADGPTATAVANCVVDGREPSYVRLDRGGLNDIYLPEDTGKQWYSLLRSHEDTDLAIVSTGIMTHQALKAAEFLNAAVVDVIKLKPIHSSLVEELSGYRRVVTLEEHRLPGGLGSIIAETFADHGIKLPLLRLAAEDRFAFELGGREVIWQNMGLDVDSIVRRIKDWAAK